MNRTNIQEHILYHIRTKPKGTIFMYSDFLHISETSTLRKAFKRLVDQKLLTRVFNGMFAILEYSQILKKEVYPSPFKIATTLARKFSWEIYPSGNTALNIIGLSTQVPNTYEYLSDGPYRSYEYEGITLYFKNTVSKKLRIGSDNLVTLVTAIDYLGKDRVSIKEIKIMKQYVANQIELKELIAKTNILPEWIYLLLKKIHKEISNDT